MRTLKIFVSSPGDVAEERTLAERVIDRLQGEDMGRIVLEPIFWEHEPLVASKSFQEQLPRPSEADVAVFILWQRLGTRLPEHITRPDGSRYASGTEFEFEDAQASYAKAGQPSMLTYRKTARLHVDLEDEEALLATLKQKKALEEFERKWFQSEDQASLIGAFHPFEKPADFEALFEAHLRKLVKRRLPAAGADEAEASAVWTTGSPFRGLETFRFEHARIFFGRTRAVGDILEALRRQASANRAFVLVLGMSGVGKSSVVRAGVLPMLTRPGVIEGIALWRRAVFRPSDAATDLFDGLARALLRDKALPELQRAGDVEETAELLRTSPQAAPPLVRQALALASGALEPSGHAATTPRSRLVLVIDQLEEIFTLERVSAEEREGFLAAVDALARSGSVWVLATMRSDFYPRCAESELLTALKEGSGQYDLPAPTPAEIGQMIRLPTRAAGLIFEGEPATGEHLADLLRDAASKSPESLPLLEFTLEELYKQRTEEGMLTLEAYRGLGGLEGSLAKRAEEVFNGLGPEVQTALPRVLNALVSVSAEDEGMVGRKRTSLKSVVTPQAKALVDAFVAARLFVTELADDGEAAVTVAHEALLQHWPPAREWLEENRQILRVRSRVRRAARRWEEDGRRADLLLPPGKPLAEAEALVGRPEVELDDVSRTFVAASLRKERRLQRLKRVVAATLALLALLAAGAAWKARNSAIRARESAEKVRAQSILLAASSAEDPLLGALLLAALDPGYEPPNGLSVARQIAERPLPRAVLRGHAGAVHRVVYSPDGATLATASEDGTARLWSVTSPREPVVLEGHDGAVTAVAFSADGAFLATGSEDATALLWRVASPGEPVVLGGHDGAVTAVAFDPGGGRLLTGSADGTVRIWDLAGQGQPRILAVLTVGRPVASAAVGVDGSRILIAAGDTASLWSADGKRLSSLGGHDGELLSAAFDAGGSRVVTASDDRTARLWHLDRRQEDQKLEHDEIVQSAVFSPDGRSVLTASDDGVARLWKLGEDEPTEPTRLPHGGLVLGAAFSPDGSQIATASSDHSVRLWSFPAEPRVLVHPGEVVSASFSADGASVLTVSLDGKARLWSADGSGTPWAVPTGFLGLARPSPTDSRVLTVSDQPAAVLIWPGAGAGDAVELRHESHVTGAVFDPSGNRVLSTSGDGIVRLWTVDAPAEPRRLEAFEPIGDAVFSYAGDRVLGTSPKGIRVWNLNDEGTTSLLEHEHAVTSVTSLPPDGLHVASVDAEGTARVWSLDSPGEPKPLGREHSASRLAFSADGSFAAVVLHEPRAEVWDLRGGGDPRPLKGHLLPINSAEFSPRGGMIVTAGRDGTARLWRARDSTELAVLTHRKEVVQASFSPDGSRVVTASFDGTARVWRVDWGELLGVLRAATTACLSQEERIRYLAETPAVAQAEVESCESRTPAG